MSTNRLRIIFMGTPEFAVPSLQALAKAHDVRAVVTAPDKPSGRGKKLSMSAVKQAALELDIPVMQPDKLKAPSFVNQIASYHADLFVVVAFRMLPEVIWAMPPKGTINLHGSLLPAYRGAAPINRAIMNGETETGLTTFFIERDIDTGAVIDRVTTAIGPNENAGDLHDRMMHLGADLLAATVQKIASEKAKGIPQLELSGAGSAPEAPKIFREDCRINWHQEASAIHNHIRGLSPYPAAFTEFQSGDGQEHAIKILESELLDTAAEAAPGTIHATRDMLIVDTAKGQIAVTALQAAGKRRMTSREFLNGFTFPEGSSF